VSILSKLFASGDLTFNLQDNNTFVIKGKQKGSIQLTRDQLIELAKEIESLATHAPLPRLD
jgi:hypothetical protein